jgi:hypothetical protein
MIKIIGFRENKMYYIIMDYKKKYLNYKQKYYQLLKENEINKLNTAIFTIDIFDIIIFLFYLFIFYS